MPDGTQQHILIVEDDGLLMRLYTKKFEKEGFAVTAAVDGSEGMVKAQNESPNLILLDLMMPKADGFVMLEALQASPQLKTIPVVVLTNVSAEADQARARSLGAVDYLVKANYPPDMVVERVRDLLAAGGETEQA